jgi:hypothetical protein
LTLRKLGLMRLFKPGVNLADFALQFAVQSNAPVPDPLNVGSPAFFLLDQIEQTLRGICDIMEQTDPIGEYHATAVYRGSWRDKHVLGAGMRGSFRGLGDRDVRRMHPRRGLSLTGLVLRAAGAWVVSASRRLRMSTTSATRTLSD